MILSVRGNAHPLCVSRIEAGAASFPNKHSAALWINWPHFADAKGPEYGPSAYAPSEKSSGSVLPRGMGRSALLGLVDHEDVRRPENYLADRQVVVFAVQKHRASPWEPV